MYEELPGTAVDGVLKREHGHEVNQEHYGTAGNIPVTYPDFQSVSVTCIVFPDCVERFVLNKQGIVLALPDIGAHIDECRAALLLERLSLSGEHSINASNLIADLPTHGEYIIRLPFGTTHIKL